MDVRDDMVSSVNAQLAHVIELSCFAWFHTDARIRIRGTAMGFVAGIPAYLQAGLLPLLPAP